MILNQCQSIKSVDGLLGGHRIPPFSKSRFYRKKKEEVLMGLWRF
jgi:hypothetical protein